jgi:hypothetical protein
MEKQKPFQKYEGQDTAHKKIIDLCSGLPNTYLKALMSVGIKNNVLTIIDYIHAIQTEINLAANYKIDLIKILTKFSNYHNKEFKKISRDDIITFLNSFKKSEIEDPKHGWIGNIIFIVFT